MGPERVISIAMGDVDWLPATENVLVAYGALLHLDSLGKVGWESGSRQQFTQWTRPREYKRSDPPEVVYEIVMKGDRPGTGWTLFGAERQGRAVASTRIDSRATVGTQVRIASRTARLARLLVAEPEHAMADGWAIHGFQPPLATTPAPDGLWARYN